MDVSLAGLSDFAREFVARLPHENVGKIHIVGLQGELGAGKTAFVQEVAKTLGVDAPVRSPTYIIVQNYPIHHPPFSRLIHIDAYRLSLDEKDTFGWAGYAADPENLVLVEWPERLPEFPLHAPILRFEVVDDTTRSIRYVER